MRRVGAIGDIHAEDRALEKILGFLQTQGVERIVAVGDIASGTGSTLRCCRLLQQHGVEAVRGNHDRWLLADAKRQHRVGEEADEVRRYVETLPTTRSFDTPAGSLLLCHGLGEDDMNRLTPDDYGYALQVNDELQQLLASKEHRFVISGHSHRRMVKDFGGVTVINVGTLLRDHDPCFATIDFVSREVVFFDVGEGLTISEASRHTI